MKLPTPPPGSDDAIRGLISDCLQLYEERGPAAVDELLARHPDSSQLVRDRLELLGRMGLLGESPEDAPPERIGAYRVVGVLGRGGMGLVYEAEQDRPRRRVALKVLRRWPGEEGRHRFEHEAELLARLQHPGIAAVYEVGTAPVGGMTMPFFAMELVRGRPVDAYAREQGLDVRARLELLAAVADAVHHAHLKGVVHRDLKPANVLVDERGQPRVLDFGIARAIDPELELETLRTEFGQLMGTLAYMSPEQASGDPDQIDARSDVYALGAVAYELLAGRLPVRTEGRPALEALTAILEEEPPALGRLVPALAGDVETIVAKALAKEKERRYESAHELAADLRRHLAHEPIAARPATAAYQLGKFARRHKALVAGAAVALAALVLGLLGTTYGLVRASEERDDAERRFRQAEDVLDFQGRMFASADPRGEGIQVDELLTSAALLLAEGGREPRSEAAIRLMLGKAFRGIGDYQRAEPLVAAAVETFERELGPEDLQTLAARIELASLLGRPMVRVDDAERALAGVVAAARRAHGAGHDVTLDAMLVAADLDLERGRFREAIATAREVERLAGPDRLQWAEAGRRRAKALKELEQVDEALEVARELLAWSEERYGRAHPRTWGAMDTLGVMLQNVGRIEEGAPLVEDLLALRTKHLGPEHPDTLTARVNVGIGHYYRGDFDEAERLLTGALDAYERRFPADHPAALFAMNTLGIVYTAQGRPQEAEPVLRELLERTRELRGPDHHETLTAMNNLAQALTRMNRLDEAEELYLATLEGRRRVQGERHSETLIALVNLGSLYTRAGRYAEADPLLHEAVEVGREVLGPEHARFDGFLIGYAQNLHLQRRYPEAEMALLECRDRQEHADRGDHPAKRKVLQMLERLYLQWDKPEQAAIYRQLLAE